MYVLLLVNWMNNKRVLTIQRIKAHFWGENEIEKQVQRKGNNVKFPNVEECVSLLMMMDIKLL